MHSDPFIFFHTLFSVYRISAIRRGFFFFGDRCGQRYSILRRSFVLFFKIWRVFLCFFAENDLNVKKLQLQEIVLCVLLIPRPDLWSSTRVTIRFLVTSLSKALLPRLLSLARRLTLRGVLVVPNFFSYGGYNALENITFFFRILPQICSLTQSCVWALQASSPDLMAWFLLWYAFSDCHTLYRQPSGFPNHVQSIEYATSGLRSKTERTLRYWIVLCGCCSSDCTDAIPAVIHVTL